MCVKQSSSSPGLPAPCLHSRTVASTPSPGFTGEQHINYIMEPDILCISFSHTHTQSNTHCGCPVGGQLLQKWEGSPLNGFHRPATDRKVTGLTRVQHPIPHAHLASPPTILRATGDTQSQGIIYTHNVYILYVYEQV